MVARQWSPAKKVLDTLSALELIELDILKEKDFRGLSTTQADTAVDINAPTLGPVLEPAVAAPLPVVETNTPE